MDNPDIKFKIEEMDAMEFVKKVYDFTWSVADFIRDKRFQPKEGQPFMPRSDIPKEFIEEVVAMNKLSSSALIALTNLNLSISEASEDGTPGDIIEEVVINKEMLDK